MIYLNIFFLFLYFGVLCLSGGSSLLQFYISELVDNRHWMTLEQLGDFMAVSQMTPGPIGVNLATFIGYNQGGFIGGLIGTLALLLPSLVLMILATKSYEKFQTSNFVTSLMFGIKPATISLICSAIAICLGMSILSEPIPFDKIGEFLGLVENIPHKPIRFRWEMTIILVFSIWSLYKKKLGIFSVIVISAIAGCILFSLVGD